MSNEKYLKQADHLEGLMPKTQMRTKTAKMMRELVSENEKLKSKLREAEGRIYDMLLGDDGEAFSLSERYLKENNPELYAKLEGFQK